MDNRHKSLCFSMGLVGFVHGAINQAQYRRWVVPHIDRNSFRDEIKVQCPYTTPTSPEHRWKLLRPTVPMCCGQQPIEIMDIGCGHHDLVILEEI